MRNISVLFAGLLLAACSQPQAQVQSQIEAHVEQQDRCHLCGMVLVRYPGPKGVASLTSEQQLKFCSTRDLFEFVLQPDKGRQVVQALVHDMGGNDWHHPNDQFVLAQDAWFVYGSDRPAAMGPALASFADEQAAQAFADEFGGRLFRFDEISLELLNAHKGGEHGGHKGH
ncbi:NosL family protein [Ferrimonas balearica DSM 9799]|uniref:NosL family protein n=1 Tax=Ferrimonas balearica (strain DSM 9799 / CCM 4581 / KCTC 23876 / PAT) TaxID=550540 RepID=E1SRD3_FERBD|nr:nitrous oxide reductase accessory protein NosL [Ferrimonas balearica]MBY6016353.1 nitrous oxide reductase accessory protein NosL [Halomonas denitrificans]ADN75884.1 NosL family protein [Ferrimonas balearica DSM 9799]MBW3138776.1 nitrous oxide reductase accessory protein NosL [Ferrimonas balearica]MBW3163615.1 nitrous oxide reductase accessory protein NosL [Ferrimonas balearica]MBY5979569.1 nitrous oxide reductase accessory protein NosL [Ferrimonas balearica]